MAKTKTAAQLAKKAENEKKAAERLAKLQADQKLAQELRKQGYQGSDYTIFNKIEEERKAAVLAEKKAKLEAEKAAVENEHKIYLAKKQAAQQQFVEESLDGPSGAKYKEWLKGKPATFKNCELFFKRSDLPRTAKEVAPEVAEPVAAEPVAVEIVPVFQLEIDPVAYRMRESYLQDTEDCNQDYGT